jgi:hypothetical protein
MPSSVSPFLLAGALILALIFGYLAGRITTVRFSIAGIPPVFLRENTQHSVPTVHITGLQNGNIVGSMEGDVRMWLGDTQILSEEDGTFAVAPGPLLVNTISVLIPDGMKFVASKRGKKYYTVSEAGGQRIVPGNRLYFETAEKAESAGYIR